MLVYLPWWWYFRLVSIFNQSPKVYRGFVVLLPIETNPSTFFWRTWILKHGPHSPCTLQSHFCKRAHIWPICKLKILPNCIEIITTKSISLPICSMNIFIFLLQSKFLWNSPDIVHIGSMAKFWWNSTVTKCVNIRKSTSWSK